MPELPEIETIKRGLAKAIIGRKIVAFDDRDAKVVQIKKEEIVGSRIKDIWRRAKIVIFELISDKGSFDSKKPGSAQDFGEKALLFHLKMTGQMIWEACSGEKDFCLRNRKGGGHPDKAWLEKLPNKHTRAIFKFDDGSVMYFNDIRRFGWIRKAKTKELKNQKTKELMNLGVEPLGSELTTEYLTKMAKRFPGRKIKQFIMDQSIIAGIGNIYADEALFDAKIKPMRLVKNIKKSEWTVLIQSIKKVLEKGIKYGGSSAENFVDAYGQQGKAHEKLLIYRKTGSPCPGDCGGVVERTVIGGRSTHWCSKCQK